MLRLIYTSKIAKSIAADDIEGIIRSSRAYNARAAVTGLLISNFDCFFQVLEGPDILVKLLFDKIKLDPRHESVQLVASSQTRHRMFPEWTMGYLMLPAENPPLINEDWTKLTSHECNVLLDIVAPPSQNQSIAG